MLQRIGGGALHAQQAYTRNRKSLMHDWSPWRNHKKCGIEFSCAERICSLPSANRQQGRRFLIDTIIRQQPKRYLACPAAFLINPDTLPSEIGKLRNTSALSHQDPDRLVIKASEGAQGRGFGACPGAALHKGDIHFAFLQEIDVFYGT